jgi:hypothetical protein
MAFYLQPFKNWVGNISQIITLALIKATYTSDIKLTLLNFTKKTIWRRESHGHVP